MGPMDETPVTVPEIIKTSEIATLSEDIRDAELRETDLSRKKVFAAISRGLTAKKPVINKYGSIVGEIDDYAIQLMAAKEAREVLADVAIKKNNSTGKMPPIIIKHSDGSVIAIGSPT